MATGVAACFIFAACAFSATVVARDGSDFVEVSSPAGTVRGVRVEGDDDFSGHFRFLGLPYAEPPVGDLRFRDPVPKAKPWEGVRNATEFGSNCPQIPVFSPNEPYNGDEDCLFLNVFTPVLPARRRGLRGGSNPHPANLLPVMFYVHGGGFAVGSGDRRPSPLLEKGVVVVTSNYRLSALGFLSLPNPLASGNQGLKDQLEALEWVQRNIASFGGDPSRVTIFGYSAGGMMAHLLSLSPRSRGLFRSAIAMSNCALSLSAPVAASDAEWESQRFLSAVGCQGKGSEEGKLECLQGKSVDELFSAARLSQKPGSDIELLGGKTAPYGFAPTIDINSQPSPVIPKHPLEILARGEQLDIPVMMGATKDDGANFVIWQWDRLADFGRDFSSALGPLWLFSSGNDTSTERQKTTSEIVQRFYVGQGRNFSRETKQEAVDFYSEMFVKSPAYQALRYHSRKSPSFLYEVVHKASRSVSEGFLPGEDFGVVHGDDFPYTFDTLEGAVATQEDRAVREAVSTMWANFAAHGDPTPYRDGKLTPWPQFEAQKEQYLEILPVSKARSGYHPASMLFWDKVYWDGFWTDEDDDNVEDRRTEYSAYN